MRRRERAATLARAIVALGGFIWLAFVLGPAAALGKFPSDGFFDLVGARAFWAGESPYDPAVLARAGLTGMGHPPTTFFWFLPLAGLDPHPLNLALGTVTMVLLGAHAGLLAFELGGARWLAAVPLLAAAILSTEWMENHLELGQISMWIAFLYLGGWIALRRGRDVLAGVCLGAACTLKLFPGVMLVYLLVVGRRRAFVAGAVTYLAVALFMTARFGPHAWWLFFTQQDEIARFWLTEARNTSLLGIVLRFFAGTTEINQPVPPAALVVALSMSLSLLGIGFSLSHRWGRAGQAGGAAPAGGATPQLGAGDLCYALVATISYFVNPWAWEHYNVFLLLPLAVGLTWLAATISRRRVTQPPARAPQATVLVCATAALAAAAALLMTPLPRITRLALDLGARVDVAYDIKQAAACAPAVLVVLVMTGLLARREPV